MIAQQRLGHVQAVVGHRQRRVDQALGVAGVSGGHPRGCPRGPDGGQAASPFASGASFVPALTATPAATALGATTLIWVLWGSGTEALLLSIALMLIAAPLYWFRPRTSMSPGECGATYAPAASSRSRWSCVRSSVIAGNRSSTCAALVALAIGAVTPGCAISHASAI